MIVKTALLACGVDRAFAVFTAEASVWWPAECRHTGDADSTIVMEASGRFYERSRDGEEIELGRVRVWEPPHRLVLDWYPGTDPEHPTEVTVAFAAEGSGTRITIEHRSLPASEALWRDRAARYDASWDRVLAAVGRRDRIGERQRRLAHARRADQKRVRAALQPAAEEYVELGVPTGREVAGE